MRCGKTQYTQWKNGKAICKPRTELKKHPPASFVAVLPLSKPRATMKGVSNQMRRDYGLDFGYTEDGEGYEMVFYGGDLRSYCGEVIDWDDRSVIVKLRTRHWLDWKQERNDGRWENTGELDDTNGYYNNRYYKILKQAESITVGSD
jgi:hypothetical protein